MSALNLVVLGLSHRTAPVDVRERFAYAESAVPEALARLRARSWVREATLISTCNRVELYAVTEANHADAETALKEFLAADRAVSAFPETGWYALRQEDGVAHLFRVASGLDSLVLGETEILGQLKQAYQVALQHGHTGRVLNKLFQSAFSAAKRVRSETQIQRGNTSVASVAVELAEKIFDGLEGREVMVIGAGDTSEKTARALVSRGARSVLVSNRSFDRAAALANELGGRAIHFDEWDREFARLDIIISSTSAPHIILDRPRLAQLLHHRPARPLLLVDLAVPRDIDPDVKQLSDVFLANVDDLQAIAEEHLRSRREEQARCEAIILERVQAWVGQWAPRPATAREWAFE